MKEWLVQLEQRERVFLYAGIAVVILFLFYLIAARPLINSHTTLGDQFETKQADYIWMQDSAIKAKSLIATNANTNYKDKRTLIARVSAELATAGIAAKQTTPEGTNRLRLELSAVDFVKLMQQLEILQNRFGVSVTQATFEPEDKHGLVNAKLTLIR
jgi:type II secretory pathway component PulM